MHISQVVSDFCEHKYASFSDYYSDIQRFKIDVTFKFCDYFNEWNWEFLDKLDQISDENFYEILNIMIQNCGPNHKYFKRFYGIHMSRINPEKVDENYRDYFIEWCKFYHETAKQLSVLEIMHKKMEE